MKKVMYIFGVAVGFGMLGIWAMLLTSGQVAELKSEPLRILSHIASEVITALLLIIGGFSALRKLPRGITVFQIALGALLYSVLNAGGYYIQKGDAAMAIMFIVFFLLDSFFIIMTLRPNHIQKGT